MPMDKTSVFAFPTPTFQYGSADGAAAAAEFTSSMTAAEGAIVAAINTVSNAISNEVSVRTAAANTLSNNISVVSALLGTLGDANVVSAQLVSVSAVLQGGINTVSNALSVEVSNRTSAVAVAMNAVSVVSNALSAEIVARTAAVNAVSNAVSVISNALSIVSNAVSVVSAAGILKAVNTAPQATISVSAGVAISGLALTLVASGNYYFRFVIPYTIDALNGVTIGVSGPTVNNFVAKTEIPTTGTANATTYAFGTIGTIGNKISTASNPLTGGVTLVAFVEGFINPSNTTALTAVIGPTVAGVNLVVQKGALGVAWRIS